MRVLELESISFTLKFNSQLPEGSSSYPPIFAALIWFIW